MANPRYNTQVTNQRGGSARVGKMGGGMMMQRPMYKKGGQAKKFREIGGGGKYKYGPHKVDVNRRATESLLGKGKIQEKIIKFADKFDKKQEDKRKNKKRVKKMAGGRIAGAARRAQEHGYYTPDMGMKGGRMYNKGGKVKKPKVKKIAIGIGKAKDYPGIKKIIEMNKKGKKRFKDGGMTKGVKEDPRRDQMKQPLKTRSGGRKTNPFDPNKDPKKRATKGFKDGGSALKAVDKSKNPGLAKLPTQVRNKMGYMKDGGKVKKGRKVKPLSKPKPGSYEYYLLNRPKHSPAPIKPQKKKDGGLTRNTRRMNRLEELGRVDAERGFTRKGKRNLKAEKKRIIGELN